MCVYTIGYTTNGFCTNSFVQMGLYNVNKPVCVARSEQLNEQNVMFPFSLLKCTASETNKTLKCGADFNKQLL